MSESKKAFEAWAKLAFPHMSLLKKGDTDKYVYKTANFACEAFCEGEAWQAALAGQAASVPGDRISVHEYTARIALQALEEYAENLSIVAGWDYEPLEHHYAQQAIEDIQDKLTEKERGHD